MSTPQRAAEGLISSLLRRQSRALHPRGRSQHGWEAVIAEPATALLVFDLHRGVAERHVSGMRTAKKLPLRHGGADGAWAGGPAMPARRPSEPRA